MRILLGFFDWTRIVQQLYCVLFFVVGVAKIGDVVLVGAIDFVAFYGFLAAFCSILVLDVEQLAC